jgi:hypothetical protein
VREHGAFFTYEAWSANFHNSGRRTCGPLRASTNSDADPIFYLKTREGELIPPKVRGNPSGNPYGTIRCQIRLVNRNCIENNEFPVILDKNAPFRIIETYSNVELGGTMKTMNALWFIALPVAGAILGWTIRWLYARFQLAAAEQKAERIKRDAVKEAESQKKEILVEAKDQIIRERNQQEREIRERRAELQRYERRVQQKEETLDKKIETSIDRSRPSSQAQGRFRQGRGPGRAGRAL